MSELEEKLYAVLSNPQLMQQIMSMAQSMNPPTPEQPVQSKENATTQSQVSGLLHSFAGQNSVDGNQEALLHALSPYLSENRVQKLERAMRAAKMAGTASKFLNSGGLDLLAGR